MIIKSSKQNASDFEKIGAFYAEVPEEYVSDGIISKIKSFVGDVEEKRYTAILLKITELLDGIQGEIVLSQSELPLLCMTLFQDYDVEGHRVDKEIGFDGLELDVCQALDILRTMEKYGLIVEKAEISNYYYPNSVESVSVRLMPKAINFVRKFKDSDVVAFRMEIGDCKYNYQKGQKK